MSFRGRGSGGRGGKYQEIKLYLNSYDYFLISGGGRGFGGIIFQEFQDHLNIRNQHKKISQSYIQH